MTDQSGLKEIPKVFSFLGRKFTNNPLGFLSEISRVGDVVKFRIGTQDIIFLNHPDFIKDVLVTNAHKFIKGRVLQKAKKVLNEGLLTSEGEIHLKHRKMIQPAFHRQRIAEYSKIMTECAAEWVEKRFDGEILEIDKQMNRLTLKIVAKALFSADVDDEADEVGKALTSLVEMFKYALLPFSEILEKLPLPQVKKMKRARETLDEVIYKIIKERRQGGHRKDDLLSILLQTQDEEDSTKLTDQQIRDEALTLFLAGHETTANALTFTWYLLSQNADKEEKLHQELQEVLKGRKPSFDDYNKLKYTEAVFAEAMRLYPPAWALGRLAVESHEINGYQIPKGSLVLVSTFITHRDSRFWEMADEFLPERWEKLSIREVSSRFIYFPFGGGVRRCIGENFAWTEAVMLISTIAQSCRFRTIDPEALRLNPLITLRPKNAVKMKVEKR
ncbi:MAG: cytochrome P450 [Pyrinomonadaceae bacterium]|nr:cytochrome P450 [Pyrinomonadaceae bacterium]MCX7640377.1 cytochrome P450 [Pyrinomonadaceae bacterium]MDW8304805.1 cytochrome P450 [Acidobacteriota bacterium]